MKKGIFGTWFKELASLIFTQTVQAFLLAIIMAIIVNALQMSGGVAGTYGAGLLAIIALSQFGKIEQLIKQIFGVGSQFGPDLNNGKAGLLGALALGKMALSGGKKVLDNGAKIGTGLVGGIKSHAHTKALMAQRDELAATEEAAGIAGETEGLIDNTLREVGTGMARGYGASMANDAIGGGSGTGVSSSQIQELISAVKDQTNVIKTKNLDEGKDSKKSKLEQLDAQIAESRKNTRDHLIRMGSGFAETAAAIPAGALGAATGLAMGDFGKAAAFSLTAAGAADSVVSGTIRGAQNVGETLNVQVRDFHTDLKTANGYDKTVKHRVKDSMKQSRQNELNKASQTISRADQARVEKARNQAINDAIKKNIAAHTDKNGVNYSSIDQAMKTFNNVKKNANNHTNKRFDAGNN